MIDRWIDIEALQTILSPPKQESVPSDQDGSGKWWLYKMIKKLSGE